MFVFSASPLTNLDINLCINMYIPPNSCSAKTPQCQPCGVGTEKVSIWKPWMSLHNVCQSVRCFDVSLLKWSWQKSSGFILWAPGISILKFTAIPGKAFEKENLLSKQNVWLRVAPDEKAANHQMWQESLQIITSGSQNVKGSTLPRDWQCHLLRIYREIKVIIWKDEWAKFRL